MSRSSADPRSVATDRVALSAGSLAYVRWVVIFTLLGAAAIHASVIREHLQEWPGAGVTFIILVGLEVLLAAVVSARWSMPIALAAIAVSAATILLWAFSRTTGMPIGPEPWIPEAVGRPDVVATVLEGITIVSILPMFGRPVRSMRLAFISTRYVGLVCVLCACVGTVTWFGLVPS